MWPEYDQQRTRVKEVIIYDNVTYAVIDKLTPNTKNFVRVLAFNGKYNSAPSDELFLYTPEGGKHSKFLKNYHNSLDRYL